MTEFVRLGKGGGRSERILTVMNVAGVDPEVAAPPSQGDHAALAGLAS